MTLSPKNGVGALDGLFWLNESDLDVFKAVLTKKAQ